MPRFVESRSDQIVHRAVDDHEAFGSARFDIDDPSDEQSGGASEDAPGLEGHSEPGRAKNFAHQPGVAVWLGRSLGSVADAETTAEIDAGNAKPFRAQFDYEPGDPQEGAPKWFEIDKLRADVDSKTDRLNAGKLSRETVGGNHLIEIDAELILFQPSRNFGVGARVDVRIDPDRDRRDPASCAGDLAQLAQLRHRLDVDLVDLGVERRLELGSGLAHPREKDPLRRHTGGESAAQLAFRDDIGTGPEAGEEAQDGEVGVGLDRIADQRPLCGESLGKTLVLGGEGSCRIEVAGSADGSRDPRNRDPFGVQLIAAIGKESTHAGRDGERCWAHRAGGPADLSCRSPSARGRGWRRAERRRQRAASPSPASLRSAPSPALRERGDPAQGAGWVRAAPHVRGAGISFQKPLSCLSYSEADV